LVYLLGFIGLASIGLLPLRSWKVLKIVFGSGASHTPRKALAAFAVLVVVAALWSEVQIMVRIFRCLTQTYCGPSVASGWTYLAMLGVVYLVFEAVMFVLRKVGPKSDVRQKTGLDTMKVTTEQLKAQEERKNCILRQRDRDGDYDKDKAEKECGPNPFN
jgi:hypothetical protein